jgi:hypothetical protein
VATIAPLTPGTIEGTVTFTEVPSGVKVTYSLTSCPEGQHPTHIHAGTGCGATEQGVHWGPTRGENIGPSGGEISCDSTMKGTLNYTRLNTDPMTRWTIGGDSATDVVGHPVIIHGLTGTAREGCGVIQGAGGAGAGGAGAGGAGGSA